VPGAGHQGQALENQGSADRDGAILQESTIASPGSMGLWSVTGRMRRRAVLPPQTIDPA
jgi:hypothetical protein